jgi:hypothetical protein
MRPSAARRRIGVVHRRRADGPGGERHAEGHIRVGQGRERLRRVTGRAVDTAVEHHEFSGGEDDELAHRAPFQHVVVLLVLHVRIEGAVGLFGCDALAVLRGGDEPGIDEGPRVVAPVKVRHAIPATEEHSRCPVICGSQGQHGDRTGGRIHADDLVRHIRQWGLNVRVVIPQNYRTT